MTESVTQKRKAKNLSKSKTKSGKKGTRNSGSAADINALTVSFQQGKYSQVSVLAKVITLRFPLLPIGWLLLGASLRKMGRDSEALMPMQKLVTLLPNDAEAHSNLGNVFKELGLLDKALLSYKKSLDINPNYLVTHTNLGVTLWQLGRVNEAVDCCSRALQINPDYDQAHNNLGIILQDMNRFYEAEEAYRRALQINPGYAEAHYNLGNLLRCVGRLDESEISYREAQKINPIFAESYNNLGITLKKLRRFHEAEITCQRALELKPDYAEAHNTLGSILLEVGRLNEANLSCRRALSIKPDYAEARSSLGVILYKLGQFNESEVNCRLASEMKPNFYEAFNNLGSTLYELGRLSEAKASYLRSIEINPIYTEALLNLGHTLCYLDDLNQAADIFKKTLEIDPANHGLDAAVYLAILHYLDGDFERCKDMLNLSHSVVEKEGANDINPKVYWLYIDSLLKWHRQFRHPSSNQTHGIETLYVIGESHSLTTHGMLVRYKETDVRCSAEWILGCKQWHLGNSLVNRYKQKFESIMARLPIESKVLLAIGEIDCRLDEGIIKAWRKHPETELADVVDATTGAYIKYVAAIAQRYGHKILISGVPATNIRLDSFVKADAEQLVFLIRIFNRSLKAKAIAADLDFLDVYALTDRGDGVACGDLHIDDRHLLPSALAEAFNRHCEQQ